MMTDKTWYALGNKLYCPYLPALATHYDVKVSSLKYWRKQLLIDINWIPDQGHAEEQRVFTRKEEEALARKLLGLADDGVPITNQIAAEVFRSFPGLAHNIVESHQLRDFNASNKYIRDFRRRYSIVLRRGHLKRRPKATPRAISDYREYVKHLTADPDIDHDHILNCDETYWHTTEQSKSTWARKGQDNVHIYTDANDKAGMTVLATIDYAANKLPLVFVAKGKCERCEKSQCGFSNPIGQSKPNPHSNEIHYTERTKNGWMDNKLWSKYLTNLRQLRPYKEQFAQDSKQNRIYLTCDQFPAHHDLNAENSAEKLNIELVPIPSGATDECQALDRRIFGSVKQQARAKTNRMIAQAVVDSLETETPPKIPRQTKAEACGLLIDIWEKLPKTQIDKAWSLSLNGRENGENEDV